MQFILGWELNELWPGNELGLVGTQLRGEIHGGGQDVRNVHGFCQHPTRDDSTASDHHHGRELTLKLRDKMIDQTTNLIPGDDFTSWSLWWLHLFDCASLGRATRYMPEALRESGCTSNTAARGAGAGTRTGWPVVAWTFSTSRAQMYKHV
jgi:hypothetical protein